MKSQAVARSITSSNAAFRIGLVTCSSHPASRLLTIDSDNAAAESATIGVGARLIVAFPIANRAHRGVPVHHRHLHIHQYQIVPVRDEVLDCECAVFDFVDAVRRILQERR